MHRVAHDNSRQERNRHQWQLGGAGGFGIVQHTGAGRCPEEGGRFSKRVQTSFKVLSVMLLLHGTIGLDGSSAGVVAVPQGRISANYCEPQPRQPTGRKAGSQYCNGIKAEYSETKQWMYGTGLHGCDCDEDSGWCMYNDLGAECPGGFPNKLVGRRGFALISCCTGATKPVEPRKEPIRCNGEADCIKKWLDQQDP